MKRSPITTLARWMNPTGLQRKRLRSNRYSLRSLGRFAAGLVLAGFVGATTLFAYYSRDLPTPGKIARRTVVQSTEILDRNGRPLYEVHGEKNRRVIPLTEIPLDMQRATLAAEDKDFYAHHGFDLRGIARALLVDVFTGSKSQGGSTITQQFVKNALLTGQKSLTRKIKELILSIEIEFIYSKDEILAFYLNEIPYGATEYGVEAASQRFFGKPAKDLTLAEAAVLASIPKAPTYYSPYGSHQDDLIRRQQFILDRMTNLGFMTAEQATAAKQQPLTFQDRREGILAPHFALYVRELLVDEYGEEFVQEGGLKVTTTLDLDLQRKAEQAISDNAKRYEAKGATNAALVSLDPKTGQVLAMVGSHDYFDTEHDGNVNVTLASRQPGSSFKPIVYATAFKQRYSPAFPLWDVPTDFGNYQPNDYDGGFRGPVSIRFALANSLNIPAVKMLALVGLDEALKTARELGIQTLTDRDRYGLALVLGGGEVRLLDLTGAYAAFANQGEARDTTVILSIQDQSGKMIKEYNPNRGKRQALDPQVAYLVTDVLADNAARSAIFGSRNFLTLPDRSVAAKTGTTQEFRDAWTVGYTPSLAAGVWVGNNDNAPMRAGADGSVVAAPIWNQFMRTALTGTSAEPFERPSGITDVTVDFLSNRLPTEHSTDIIREPFARWQVPIDRDTVHVKVKVNRLNGLLATEFTPPELVEERVYSNVHSEKPSNPNWEEPVLAWARDHGIDVSPPPTEKDQLYTEATRPVVHILSPTAGQELSGAFTVKATVTGTVSVTRVEAAIDGASIGGRDASPYEFPSSTSVLAIGSHELTVTATDSNGGTTTSSLTLSVGRESKAPAEVRTSTATPGNQLVTLSWSNPLDPDLEKVRIYLATATGSLGTLYPTEVLVQPNTTSTFTLTGLANTTTYFITLRTVDKGGNESLGSTQLTATPRP
jgi:1A family penicillin-binding protein